jgi:hypothetical protein
MDNVVQLPTQQIASNLKDEVYRDVLGSPYLRDFLAMRNSGRSLDALAGIGAKQLTIFSPHVPADPTTNMEIRAVLRVAFENFALSLGAHSKATDITGDDATLSILRAKGQRLGYALEGDGAFTRIQDISGVPNIGYAFATKQLSARQLLDLRYSTHAQSLRDWFAVGSPSENAEDCIRRYVEGVGRPGWIDSLPSKVIRLAATTGIGALEPVGGAIAAGIDSFLLNKWFPSRSPRLFLRHASTVIAKTHAVPAPIMKRRGRNEQCSCGSGKKFKKCCGR